LDNTDVEAPNPGCKPKLELINLSLKSDWLIGMLFLVLLIWHFMAKMCQWCWTDCWQRTGVGLRELLSCRVWHFNFRKSGYVY